MKLFALTHIIWVIFMSHYKWFHFSISLRWIILTQSCDHPQDQSLKQFFLRSLPFSLTMDRLLSPFQDIWRHILFFEFRLSQTSGYAPNQRSRELQTSDSDLNRSKPQLRTWPSDINLLQTPVDGIFVISIACYECWPELTSQAPFSHQWDS